MKRYFIILSVLCLLVSCQSQEEKVLAEYRDFYEEVKQCQEDCTSEEYELMSETYDQMELEIEDCDFTREQQRELAKLRGKIFTSMMKIKAKVMVDEVGSFVDSASSFIDGAASEIENIDD